MIRQDSNLGSDRQTIERFRVTYWNDAMFLADGVDVQTLDRFQGIGMTYLAVANLGMFGVRADILR